ncbi:hypothetical protein RRG08_060515 [Elysia crispata]|uniref:Uncharacterized protein n=1 Tax=Elysia crispata TaxID=231223 RepID=A0AAE1AA32_9GAST|nr:hypothetical protein RRG08_060515 [Elysia crispata]
MEVFRTLRFRFAHPILRVIEASFFFAQTEISHLVLISATMFHFSFLVTFLVALATAADDIVVDEDFQETIIFLKKQTTFGQNVFIRGGVGNGTDCKPDEAPAKDPCAIPIAHLELELDSETPLRDLWAETDLFLTWGANETDQPSTALGTPAQWTTSNQNSDYFHDLNIYGENYWMVHFDMDCSKLPNGFFDFKGYLDGQWESDISQAQCTGNMAVTPPYTSNNHIARCGYVNVFEWGGSSCLMEELE